MVVLTFTLILVIIAGTILAVMTSQGRLSEHQFRRTLAYYASNSGIQFVTEMLRLGTNSLAGRMCTCCTNINAPCDVNMTVNQNGQDYSVVVHVGSQYPAGSELSGTRPVSATAQYRVP